MAAITILKENVPHGPFTRAEVADKLNSGEITLDSLAFVEGLTQWTPLREVLAKVDGATPPPPTRPVTITPPPSASVITTPPAASLGSPIAADYSYAVTMQPPGHLVYAGFWLRFVALIVDEVIIGAVVFTISFVLGVAISMLMAMGQNSPAVQSVAMGLYGVIYAISFVGRWLYFSLQESSRYQATLGKRATRIYVTDRQGNRIGFGRATGRYFGKIISFLIFCIGFMMAGWTARKQALHDMMADTLVVRKPGY